MLVPNVVTMSSLEMVEFINSTRGECEAVLRHDSFMAKVPKVLGKLTAQNFLGSYIAKDNTSRPCYNFPKREACLMAMSYSYELQARVFDRMTELENREANRVPVEETTKLELLFVESFARTCNVSESGKLGMYRRLAKNRGLDVKLLPGYAVDEPKGIITTGSSAPTNSLTELLKEHGVKKENGKFYRAVDINPLLANKGILERKSRKSSSGEDKFFWSLTTTGEAYGKNLTSDANPRETQPHYFSNKFAELLELIGL